MSANRETSRANGREAEDRDGRERALDQALDHSFPASDPPSMLRPGLHGPAERARRKRS
jgi:hypothetical protein